MTSKRVFHINGSASATEAFARSGRHALCVHGKDDAPGFLQCAFGSDVHDTEAEHYVSPCECCASFQPAFCQPPFLVDDIVGHELYGLSLTNLNRGDSGRRVIVWPHDGGGDGMGFNGFLVGKLPVNIVVDYDPATRMLEVKPDDYFPLFVVPTLKRLVWGYECRWEYESIPAPTTLAPIDPPAETLVDQIVMPKETRGLELPSFMRGIFGRNTHVPDVEDAPAPTSADQATIAQVGAVSQDVPGEAAGEAIDDAPAAKHAAKPAHAAPFAHDIEPTIESAIDTASSAPTPSEAAATEAENAPASPSGQSSAPAAEAPAFEPTPDEMGGYVFHVTMEPINDIECWERFSEKHLPVPGWVESRHPAHVFG